MRKLKRLWLSIPRPYRAIMNILASVVLIATFYVCIGAPALNDEHAFRRAEKANLVGPSTILFSEEVENYNYRHLILAETDYGVITFVDDSWWRFNYHEKTGDVTVVAAPKNWFDWGRAVYPLNYPVFLVDDYPEAVRAELDLDIVGAYTHSPNGEQLNEPLDHHYQLESHREQKGYFRFDIKLPFVNSYDEYGNDLNLNHGSDGYALDALAQNFTNFWKHTSPQRNISITATVRLYDDYDNLIAERELVLRTMSDETLNVE